MLVKTHEHGKLARNKTQHLQIILLRSTTQMFYVVPHSKVSYKNYLVNAAGSLIYCGHHDCYMCVKESSCWIDGHNRVEY